MKLASVAGMAALLVVGAGCQKKEEAPPPAGPPAVVVTTVVQRDVPVTQEWIGTTDGNVNAEIRPQVEGYLLKRVYAEGSFVRQGDTLFQIDPRQVQSQAQQAQADLAQAQAQLAKARQDVNRFRPLAEQKAISQQELDDAVTRQRTAQANLESARAALERAKLSLGWTKVVSPISGIAGVSKSQVGDLVNRQTVMTTVSQVNPIKVYFNPSEQEYLAWVARYGAVEKTLREAEQEKDLEKGKLELILSDGTVFPHHGKPFLVGREVDAKTGTIQIAGAFPNPGNVLRPGQYGKVRVAVDVRKGAILIPQRAVSELQGSYQVAVVDSANKVTMKVVKLGPPDGSQYVVDEGLKPGDRIVVEGIQRVKSGMTVVPTTAASEPAAPEKAGT